MDRYTREMIADLLKHRYIRNVQPALKLRNPYLNDMKVSAADMDARGLTYNKSPRQDMFFVDSGGEDFPEFIQNHEMDHVMTNRMHPADTKYPHPITNMLDDKKLGSMRVRLAAIFSDDKKRKQLEGRYPALTQDGYFEDPIRILRLPMTEIMANLNSIEDTYKADLLKDNILGYVFEDPAIKEAYKASTGYRRTRMDARDLPPYTPRKPEDR